MGYTLGLRSGEWVVAWVGARGVAGVGARVNASDCGGASNEWIPNVLILQGSCNGIGVDQGCIGSDRLLPMLCCDDQSGGCSIA